MANPKNTTAVVKELTGENQNPQTPELSNVTVGIDKETGEVKTQEQPTTPALPPIEARLQKLKDLLELEEKRETVVTALENLNKFYINPTGQGCNLKLTDSKGNSFGIAHPAVIGEMVHMAKTKLQDELTRIENDFVFTI